MLAPAPRGARFTTQQCKRLTSTTAVAAATKPRRALVKPVPFLSNASVNAFRKEAIEPQIPASFPRGAFGDLPAITKWFTPVAEEAAAAAARDGDLLSRVVVMEVDLNRTYLARFADLVVPLEVSDRERFARVELPLAVFLDSTTALSAATTPAQLSIYLAQAPISNLHPALQADVPTPTQVLTAGRGDVYSSSIWLGQAPTYTPLHRDPNPNLFVQLAGRKVVRLMRPAGGMAVFASVQRSVGGTASASMRGEEMMAGDEKEVLERAVWGDGGGSGDGLGEEGPQDVWEVEVCAGDGLFIPRGWWHSVKGTGEGITGSVNWWFR